jgi:hypothetical protein
MSATAAHISFACAAKTIGTTATAQMNIAVLRAAFTVQPRLINVEDSQPPPMLPMSATR